MRAQHLMNVIGPLRGPHAPHHQPPRRREHGGGDRIPCAYCHGQGDICHPDNADPKRKVTEWLYPPVCPRCGGTGKDPNP